MSSGVGTITVPFDLEADRLARLRDSEAEPDPHKAFHLRSGLRLPDPDGMCGGGGGDAK